MRNIVFLFFVLSMLAATTASAQNFRFGAGAQLVIDGGSIGVGAKGLYEINEDWAAQAGLHYYLNNGNPFSVDLEALYSGFDIGDVEGFSVRPLAGLGFFHNSVSVGGISVGGTSTRFNLGVQGLGSIGDMSIYIEPKLSIGSGTTLIIAGGILF